ncbi:MAG: MaoC family dehydratase [Candidatus Acidiferrales bacterium]
MAPLVLENLQSLKNFIGREIAVTDWLPVTQERIQKFAEATEDHQWIHLDRERAKKESPYGATIAHGFLTLSLLSYFMKQAIEIRGGIRMGINYGLNRVRFPSAVRAGSKIRARVGLQSCKELSDCMEAVFTMSIECEGWDKPCCIAEWIVRYYS